VLLGLLALTAPLALPGTGWAQMPTGGAGAGAATASNPHVSGILTGNYASFSKDPAANPFHVPGFALGPDVAEGQGKPGFQLGETELGLYSNIDPYWYGSIVLAFAPDAGASVEEAFIQSLALPWGFIVKAGRFHSSIGYLNVFHRHADDFIDTPLVYSAFLNGQLADDGAQLLWVAPTNFLLQLGGEFFNGGTWPASGAQNRGNGTNTQFIDVADDVGVGGSYLLGISHVDSQAVDRVSNGPGGTPGNGLSFTGAGALNILSGVYKWAPLGDTAYTQLKLQAEVFSGDENGTYTVLDSSGAPSATAIDVKGSQHLVHSGWYAQTVLKFQQRWKVGARYSEVSTGRIQDPNAAGTALDAGTKTPNIASAMVEYWPSEFSQFRLQYSQDHTDPKQSVDVWYLQYIITMGAHAAHTY
ncbi:MAG TPA: hypothetical protein VL359_02155, partial [bacterium]|nr:hypothetical protein [bacterium]